MCRGTEVHHLKATFLPFLYQTRTIIQLSQPRHCLPQSFFGTTRNSRLSSNKRIEGPPAPKTGFLKSKADDARWRHAGKKDKGTTITRAERKVFDNIFADIAGSGEEDVSNIVDESRGENAALDLDSILALFSNAEASHQSEQKALAQREAARAVVAAGKVDAEDQEKLQQYPRSLRKAARRAQLAATKTHGSDHEITANPVHDTVQDRRLTDRGTIYASQAMELAVEGVNFKTRTGIAGQPTPEEDTSVPIKKHLASEKHQPTFEYLLRSRRSEDISNFSTQFSALRPDFVRNGEAADATEQELREPDAVFNKVTNEVCRNSMLKISNSFQRAINNEGAMGLWKACHSDIFPMIGVLEESLRTEERDRQRELSRTAKAPKEDPSPSPKAQQSSTNILDIPPYIQPLHVISRVYPAALLLALRLLVKHFPDSPIALALLPEIRSNGATSYVLGASVHFYNTLLSLEWDVYSALRSIDHLLLEMERNGVEFDLDTWEVLVKIREERAEDLKGDRGKQIRGKLYWERPMHAKWYQEVGVEWKAVIAARLQERGIGVTTQEDESSAPVWV